jgi:hypothetical protein
VAVFRDSKYSEGIGSADALDGAREIVQSQPSGSSDVNEIRAAPFPSGHTSRQWGRIIRLSDGGVEDEPWPWDASMT